LGLLALTLHALEPGATLAVALAGAAAVGDALLAGATLRSVRAVAGDRATLTAVALSSGRTVTGVTALLAGARHAEFFLLGLGAILVGIAVGIRGAAGAARDRERE